MPIQPLLRKVRAPHARAGAKARDKTALVQSPQRLDPEAEIGEQLRELRLVKNLALREVAEKAGISVSYLSQLERNQSRLPIGVLKKISDALGVHMNWFFQSQTGGDAAERDVVVRAANRRRMSFTSGPYASSPPAYARMSSGSNRPENTPCGQKR